MYRSILLLCTIFITMAGFSQKDIVATIDGKPIQKDEFSRLYKKNNQNLLDETEKKTPLEYIDLFINYKLKVHEAEQLGLDTLPSFLKELNTYREQLARPYLTDVKVTNKMVKDAYQRSVQEVKASHILLRLNENTTDEDTLKVYKRIMEIREEIVSGENFEDLAFKYSEDPSAKKNKGLLGYFSAFQMVFPFEHAAFNTEVGEISMPVRTRFGYHLIHILDKRNSKGKIKVAHIMKRFPPDASEEFIKKARQLTDSIARLIQSGEDFADLARRFSDDKRSANNGGEMSWFSSSGMLPEFSEPAFELQNDGDISPVIKTPYGWHIIKRISRKPVDSFEEMEQLLIDKIRKNPEISKHSKRLFINKLKKEYQFKSNEELISKLKATGIDKIKPEEIEEENSTLFTFADQKATLKDFSMFAGKDENKKLPFNQLMESFTEEQLTNFENDNLENKYPDFKYMMQEYHDGILLFNISEQKIWSEAAVDSVGLSEFYQKNKSKHQWGERFSGWVIKCPNQEAKDHVDKILASDDQCSPEELTDQITQLFNVEIDAQKAFFEKGDNPLVDFFVWNGLQPEDFNESLHFIRGNKIKPSPKTLEEAKGLFISDYQNMLEEKWIKELKKKYKVKVNKKVVKTVKPV